MAQPTHPSPQDVNEDDEPWESDGEERARRNRRRVEELREGAAPVCGVCGERPSRYCCPGCTQRFCGLDCSRQHKKDAGCSGKRDRTAFVSLPEMDSRHLHSDYQLLEETARAADNAKRQRPAGPDQVLPRARSLLRQHAAGRGIEVLFQAPGMERSRANSSRVVGGAAEWTVQWAFLGAPLRLLTKRAHEKREVGKLLRQVLDTSKPGAAQMAHELRQYVDALAEAAEGVGCLKLLMRAERRPANQPGYYAVDPEAALGDVLSGKVVVEFPTIVVGLPGEAEGLPMIAQGGMELKVYEDTKGDSDTDAQRAALDGGALPA